MVKKLKYNDVPRFDLINQYENAAKKDYRKIIVNTVKMLGTKMLHMVKSE